MYCRSESVWPWRPIKRPESSGLHIEHDAVIELCSVNRGGKAEEFEQFFQRGFGLRGHKQMGDTDYFFFFDVGVNAEAVTGAASGGVGVDSASSHQVWKMVNRLLTVM
jgi:hypothetical protein